MASELSELREELWRTRDDLERIKSRTANIDGYSRVEDQRGIGQRRDRGHFHVRLYREGRDDEKGTKLKGGSVESNLRGGVGASEGLTSLPTSGDSETSENNRVSPGHHSNHPAGSHSPVNAEAEATLSSLELEGAAFKNWTEEASSIAVRLIEEVKALRWERETWRANEVLAARAIADLRARTEDLEARLSEAEAEGRRSREALHRAQSMESEQAHAVNRARADLRAMQEQKEALQARVAAEAEWGRPGKAEVERGLREELRREKEGTDALHRRLDAARAAISGFEQERREWRASKARLGELRQSWGKQLKKVAKKMRSMSKENTALQDRMTKAERARDHATADASRHQDDLRRLTEQRDNLLLGAARAGHASSPADALVKLLAAAAAVGVAGARTGHDFPPQDRSHLTGREERIRGIAREELESALEQARAETKIARVEARQERLRREGALREKDEAIRQLRQLMGAARRAVGRKNSKLRSSRMETEIVWNALAEAVR